MNIKKYLDSYYITTAGFAKRAGVTREYMDRIKNGHVTPSKKLALKMEELTEGKVTAEALLLPEKFKNTPDTCQNITA